jgi:hypothetical protein
MQRNISKVGWSNFGRRVSRSRASPHFSHAGSGFGPSAADASSGIGAVLATPLAIARTQLPLALNRKLGQSPSPSREAVSRAVGLERVASSRWADNRLLPITVILGSKASVRGHYTPAPGRRVRFAVRVRISPIRLPPDPCAPERRKGRRSAGIGDDVLHPDSCGASAVIYDVASV